MTHSLFKAMALSICALLAACQEQNGEAPLRIGMIPDAGGSSASIADKEPLVRYLTGALGREIELIIPTNYNATVEALGNGSLDIAYLGGLTFVKAKNRYGARPLVQRAIDQEFHSVFITRPETGIENLADLAGRSICFGDINSTSGHLIPRKEMADAGVSADDVEKSRHTGSHPATAQGVANKACDAGAMDKTVYDRLVADGQIDPENVRVFAVSKPFANYVWAANSALTPMESAAFSNAMVALERGTDDQVLDILRGDEFLPASAEAYSNVEEVAAAQGLL